MDGLTPNKSETALLVTQHNLDVPHHHALNSVPMSVMSLLILTELDMLEWQ